MMNAIAGLVVQGGAMRAIYSMAALCVLQEKEMTYEHVLGASAGAMNAAYFVAGQSDDSLAAYLNDINVRAFINPWRMLKIVNTDYLVDEIFKKRRPLSVERIEKSATTLHIAVTDYETRQGSFITNRDKNVDIFEALRASAAMPIFYGRTVEINGRRYIDGGLRNPVPVRRALEVGCTDITVVLTQATHPVLAELAQFQTLGVVKSVKVIAPSNPKRMVTFTQNMNLSRLNDCVKMAQEDTLRALS